MTFIFKRDLGRVNSGVHSISLWGYKFNQILAGHSLYDISKKNVFMCTRVITALSRVYNYTLICTKLATYSASVVKSNFGNFGGI